MRYQQPYGHVTPQLATLNFSISFSIMNCSSNMRISRRLPPRSQQLLLSIPRPIHRLNATLDANPPTTMGVHQADNIIKRPLPSIQTITLSGVTFHAILTDSLALWQICHTSNVCRSRSHNHFEAKANFAAHTTPNDPWIVDSGASHHIAAPTPSTMFRSSKGQRK